MISFRKSKFNQHLWPKFEKLDCLFCLLKMSHISTTISTSHHIRMYHIHITSSSIIILHFRTFAVQHHWWLLSLTWHSLRWNAVTVKCQRSEGRNVQLSEQTLGENSGTKRRFHIIVSRGWIEGIYFLFALVWNHELEKWCSWFIRRVKNWHLFGSYFLGSHTCYKLQAGKCRFCRSLWFTHIFYWRTSCTCTCRTNLDLCTMLQLKLEQQGAERKGEYGRMHAISWQT